MNKFSTLSMLFLTTLFSIASFADTRGGGKSTINDVTLNNAVDEPTDIWETLLDKSITLASASKCEITVCSDVANDSDTTVGNLYHFVISLDDTSPGLNTGAERSLELSNNSTIDDPNIVPVCSTLHTAVPAGTHHIYWLGSKATLATHDTHVEDTSMSIGCFDGNAL